MFKITLEPRAAEKLESLGLLILRVATGGLMMILHGWPKLMTYSAKASEFPDPLGVSPHVSLALVIFAEFFCSGLIVLGVSTRLAAIPAVINMLVAVLVIHKHDPWSQKEHALVYLIPFVTILLTGPGAYTVTGLFSKKKA